ncbi:MAG: hypothetical protein M3R43_07830 [Acidobacteriota bacterium]|nr:hypothetical protein [Acidobacteriota bacterium]
MKSRSKVRLNEVLVTNANRKFGLYGCMRGSAIELGDIVAPAWEDGPWDAELGISYHGDNDPVYYTGNGTETTDDLL